MCINVETLDIMIIRAERKKIRFMLLVHALDPADNHRLLLLVCLSFLFENLCTELSKCLVGLVIILVLVNIRPQLV